MIEVQKGKVTFYDSVFETIQGNAVSVIRLCICYHDLCIFMDCLVSFSLKCKSNFLLLEHERQQCDETRDNYIYKEDEWFFHKVKHI